NPQSRADSTNGRETWPVSLRRQAQHSPARQRPSVRSARPVSCLLLVIADQRPAESLPLDSSAARERNGLERPDSPGRRRPNPAPLGRAVLLRTPLRLPSRGEAPARSQPRRGVGSIAASRNSPCPVQGAGSARCDRPALQPERSPGTPPGIGPRI